MTRLLCSGLLFAALAMGDFDAKQWHFRVPLSITAGSSISEFTVTPEIFRHSTAHLNDLRIIRDDRIEVPYSARMLAGDLQENERSVRFLNKAWTKNTGVRAVLDLNGHADHNRLRIATAEHNFKEAVIVETSDDAKRWSTVLADGVIFDIARPEANVSDTTVTYPTSTRRYVRVTIPGWTDPASLGSAWLAEYKESAATRDDIATLRPAVKEHKAEQTTDFIFDLGYSGQPCDRLVLQVESGLFSRMVEVSTSDDLKIWAGTSGGYIFRTSSDENRTVNFGETWDRYVKLTVFNGDSAPLALKCATASAVRRAVRFPSDVTGSYRLYLDNALAHSPAYDFPRVDDPKIRAGVATAGMAELNPAFHVAKAPFSERKPWVLNLILAIGVAVMAWITYRFARKAAA